MLWFPRTPLQTIRISNKKKSLTNIQLNSIFKELPTFLFSCNKTIHFNLAGSLQLLNSVLIYHRKVGTLVGKSANAYKCKPGWARRLSRVLHPRPARSGARRVDGRGWHRTAFIARPRLTSCVTWASWAWGADFLPMDLAWPSWSWLLWYTNESKKKQIAQLNR